MRDPTASKPNLPRQDEYEQLSLKRDLMVRQEGASVLTKEAWRSWPEPRSERTKRPGSDEDGGTRRNYRLAQAPKPPKK
ncbi:similar to An16g07840 [Aspergillus luchuensis]|uniref:Similar to An16g07840 n=1 Tax=Aspergillus kawachii TaxID=1069201 RepID=A0A146F2I0_ASPKA|nr:similar to An16g07840 [Aspergillus luchuensis]